MLDLLHVYSCYFIKLEYTRLRYLYHSATYLHCYNVHFLTTMSLVFGDPIGDHVLGDPIGDHVFGDHVLNLSLVFGDTISNSLKTSFCKNLIRQFTTDVHVQIFTKVSTSVKTLNIRVLPLIDES